MIETAKYAEFTPEQYAVTEAAQRELDRVVDASPTGTITRGALDRTLEPAEDTLSDIDHHAVYVHLRGVYAIA